MDRDAMQALQCEQVRPDRIPFQCTPVRPRFIAAEFYLFARFERGGGLSLDPLESLENTGDRMSSGLGACILNAKWRVLL